MNFINSNKFDSFTNFNKNTLMRQNTVEPRKSEHFGILKIDPD